MTARLDHFAWIIVNPQGLPLLHSVRGAEAASWMAAEVSACKHRLVMEQSGYRAVEVWLIEIGVRP